MVNGGGWGYGMRLEDAWSNIIQYNIICKVFSEVTVCVLVLID